MAKRGRPTGTTNTPIPVYVFNWVLIEMARDTERISAPRRSVREACTLVEQMYAQRGENVPASTLRRYHREVERMHEEMGDPDYRDRLLAEVRARRVRGGWKTHPLVLLGII